MQDFEKAGIGVFIAGAIVGFLLAFLVIGLRIDYPIANGGTILTGLEQAGVQEIPLTGSELEVYLWAVEHCGEGKPIPGREYKDGRKGR